MEGKSPWLKARNVDDPNQPPYNGWSFLNARNFVEDKNLTCSSVSLAKLPCSVTVSLSGPAKEKHGKCEGVYKNTELMSMGRQVNIISS